ncbi:hypothetical protein AB0368_06915 [Actinoplanes sp. NPDC051475]|uniref:hypothetical protein n=1 Tax=Actinoplanes sp. NPDC051475 TaxID=3157225 RepID=UPI00344F3B07
MRIATWQEDTDEMSGLTPQHRELRDWTISRLQQPLDGGYRDACRRVAALMAELLEAEVDVRFIAMRSPGLTGGTARCADGRYIIYCAKSRSWYHRFTIMLHELAHVLLGHRPVELNTREGLRRFLPHLPDPMIALIAGRTDLAADEERDAEELADSILAHLTDTASRAGAPSLPFNLPEQVRRVADAFEDHSRPESP